MLRSSSSISAITKPGIVLVIASILATGFERSAAAQESDPNATANQESDKSVVEGADAVALTRGPLHEAFAEPHNLNAEPSKLVDEDPPANIDETPPDYRPEGNQIEWIPGYWAWEPADTRFIWISGLWRDIPPGKRWVPGYWEKADGGNRWISGFWTDQQTDEVVYLPQPPQSVENGPSASSPGSDYFYVPGIWLYDGNSYNWRPGHWAPHHEHWVWVPATYMWTPRGCIFRPGFWDLEVFDRGVVFAPVYFSQPVYRQPNYHYSPRVVIDFDVNLFVHLFLRPDRNHYYYGDYYGAGGGDSYYAWSDLHTRHHWYDPLYAYYDSRSGRENVNFVDWVDRQHQYFVQNARYRPPTTFRGQVELANELRSSNDLNVARMVSLGHDIEEVASAPDAATKLHRVTKDEQRAWRERVTPYRELAENRIRGEVSTSKREANAANKAGLALPRFEQSSAGQVNRDPSERANENEPNRRSDPADRGTAKPEDRKSDTKSSDRPTSSMSPRPNDWPRGRRERGDVPRERPETEPSGGDKAADPAAATDPTPIVDPRTSDPGVRGNVPKEQRKEQPKSAVPNRATTPATTSAQPRRRDQSPPKREGVQRSYRPGNNSGDGERSPPSNEKDGKGAKPEQQPPQKDRPRSDEQRGRDKEKDKKEQDKDGS